jgi:hypothetical protein
LPALVIQPLAGDPLDDLRRHMSVSAGFPRWSRLGLAITEVVLAAGLIVAAVTEGDWYWWAGAIAAATLALINLSVYLRTERERRRPPDP